MYTTINGQQFHTIQAHSMGKDAFIQAHKGSVRDVVKVWEQIEREALRHIGVNEPQSKPEKAPKVKK